MAQSGFPSGPAELVASYQTYADAQRAVDFLADRRFPVERLAIVAGGLRLVEQITGRVGYGEAALQGAAAGALPGALLGFVFGLFSLTAPAVSGLSLALLGLLVGGVVGALVGLVTHAFSQGRRDFSSVRGFEAERYDVVAETEVAGEARRLVSSAGFGRAA